MLFALYGTVSYFIADGLTHADRRPQEATPADFGLRYESVTFAARGDAVSLNGWYLEGDPGRPAVIFVHGLNATRSREFAVELASRLVRQGHPMLLFDLRGHGDSGGDRISGGYFERADVLGAYDYLRQRGHRAIGLLGYSMGAGIALLAAAEEPGIRAVVADSPFAVASERIAFEASRKTRIPAWLTPAFMPTASAVADALFRIDVSAIAPERAVRRIPYPILVIHGTADSRIPTEDGMRVHRAAAPGSDLWLAPAADHVRAFRAFPDEYVARVGEYYEARFKE